MGIITDMRLLQRVQLLGEIFYRHDKIGTILQKQVLNDRTVQANDNFLKGKRQLEHNNNRTFFLG